LLYPLKPLSSQGINKQRTIGGIDAEAIERVDTELV
jgi:hypothetical protein